MTKVTFMFGKDRKHLHYVAKCSIEDLFIIPTLASHPEYLRVSTFHTHHSYPPPDILTLYTTICFKLFKCNKFLQNPFHTHNSVSALLFA